MRISVSMIVLNEERNIGRALASCSFADEIVVVDGGSGDLTTEILERDRRVVLVRRPWGGHFGDQRQASLDRCTGDWVIRLDADEAFSEEFERGIRGFLDNLPPDVAAITIRQCNLVGSESFYSKAYDDYEGAPRIWRNRPEVRWEGHIHEHPAGIEGKVVPIDAYVVHYGFLDWNRYGEKGSFYSEIPGSGFGSREDLVFREYDIQPRPPRSAVGNLVPPYTVEKEHDRSGLPRVAIVRGPNLNPWEMQNYEPLSGEFDLTAYTTTTPNFDISLVALPVVKVPSDPEHPGYMKGLEFALFDADLIYSADTTWLFSYQAGVIREKFGKKLVCLQWENIPFAYEESKEMREMKAVVRRRADHFVAVTERAREALILEGVDRGRITVIPMGIDTERFRPDEALREACRKELGIDRDEKVVLFTGRMVWEKGVYDFVHAAKLAHASAGKSPVRFVMVGKGPERDAVMARAGEIGIGKLFLFIEGYPYDRMRDLYNAADVFVLPSISMRMWKEQFGMVLVEAMACGTPVVSTTSGSIPEVVGNAGILVPANDPGELAGAIALLCSADEMRDELGRKGRARAVEGFDSKTVAKRMGEVFKMVLEGSAPPPDSPRHREIVSPPTPSNHFAAADTLPGAGASAAPAPVMPNPGDEPREEATKDRGYFQQERREIEAMVPAGASRILDIGCGEGMLGRILLQKGAAEVVGIEADPAVARRAKENLSRVLQGDVESLVLPFEDGYFDCIVLADVLEHLKDPLSTMIRLQRYLSDSGTIVASIPNVRFFEVIRRLAEGRWEYEEFGILDKTHLRFFTKKEIEVLFLQAGLELTGISENLSPIYFTLPSAHSGDVSFGRVTLHGLTREETKDLFVIQYLLVARKADSEASGRDRRVSAALESGDLESARSTLEEFLEEHPLDADALLRHSEICSRLGRRDEAIADLDKVLLFHPGRKGAFERKAALAPAPLAQG
ncbi:MAG: glycosyltransferase [Desulfobacteria bacterium]